MSFSSIHEFSDSTGDPPVRGFLHDPEQTNAPALVLTHGAGADCQSRLLVSLAGAFAERGFLVLRCDLPFRTERRHGPPSPGNAERDRRGLQRAVELMRARTAGPIYLGGHSYGGRQASMLAADEPDLVKALLLLSYPLHPPRRPQQLRTAHFPDLTTPAMFVHGSRDPFASRDELESAIALLPAPHRLLHFEGRGHDLLGRETGHDTVTQIVEAFHNFIAAM
jgi:uncharacterized protein